MWLPLALADISLWLTVLVRMNGDKRTRELIQVPKVSEKLAEWALPFLSRSVAEDERRADDERRKRNKANFYDNIMALAESVGAKVEVKNGN